MGIKDRSTLGELGRLATWLCQEREIAEARDVTCRLSRNLASTEQGGEGVVIFAPHDFVVAGDTRGYLKCRGPRHAKDRGIREPAAVQSDGPFQLQERNQ